GEGRLGVLIEINCETDFVARTEDFKTLARDVAMQVAASDPRYVSRDDVPEDVLAAERQAYLTKAQTEGKNGSSAAAVAEEQLAALGISTTRCSASWPGKSSPCVRSVWTWRSLSAGETSSAACRSPSTRGSAGPPPIIWACWPR